MLPHSVLVQGNRHPDQRACPGHTSFLSLRPELSVAVRGGLGRRAEIGSSDSGVRRALLGLESLHRAMVKWFSLLKLHILISIVGLAERL